MQKLHFIFLFATLLFAAALPAVAQDDGPAQEEDLLINLSASGANVNNAVDIQQVGNTNESEIIQRGRQEVQLLQQGNENRARMDLAGPGNEVGLQQLGDNNVFDLGIGAGFDNSFDVLQRNDNNDINLQFGIARELDMTIFQNGENRVDIDLQDANSMPLPNRIIQLTPNAPDVIISDPAGGSGPIGIFNNGSN